jgi:hypothetical protein
MLESTESASAILPKDIFDLYCNLLLRLMTYYASSCIIIALQMMFPILYVFSASQTEKALLRDRVAFQNGGAYLPSRWDDADVIYMLLIWVERPLQFYAVSDSGGMESIYEEDI